MDTTSKEDSTSLLNVPTKHFSILGNTSAKNIFALDFHLFLLFPKTQKCPSITLENRFLGTPLTGYPLTALPLYL